MSEKKKISGPLTREKKRFLWKFNAVKVSNGELCSICLEAMSSACLRLPCSGNHIYHSKCLEQWFEISSICPTCRGTLKIPIKKIPSKSRMTIIQKELAQQECLEFHETERSQMVHSSEEMTLLRLASRH